MDRMREDIRRDLSYMPYAPIVFISAMTGQRVSRLFELINYVREQASMRITTGMLNSVLADAQTRVQPPTDKGRRLKIYYMTQVGIRPPTLWCFGNDKKLFHFSCRRYLETRSQRVRPGGHPHHDRAPEGRGGQLTCLWYLPWPRRCWCRISLGCS